MPRSNADFELNHTNTKKNVKKNREAFGETESTSTTTATAATAAETPPSSPSTSSKPKPKNTKPFGFRRFKGHKHDREAAARRAKTELYISSGEADADIRAHKAARREAGLAGASPVERLLTQASELRKRIGRSAPVTGKQVK